MMRRWMALFAVCTLVGCGGTQLPTTPPPVSVQPGGASPVQPTPTPTLIPDQPGMRSPTATPVGTTAEDRRAATFAATITAVAVGVPRPVTPTFQPAIPSPIIAATASVPVMTPRPTVPGVILPREGTPRSIPAKTGELISVGERRMWIACEGDGGPTVVMDAGVNSGSQIWTFAEPGIARLSRVCVYDRAGLGRSDPIPRPRTSQEVVDDLHMLLRNANVPGPYVLVAHSFGGLNVRLFSGQYPQEVVGMVLVDAVHEDRFAATAKVLTPEQEKDFERGREANPEGLDYYESSRLVRDLGKSLPAIPIVVIARGRAELWPDGWPTVTLEGVWRQLEADLASRAPRGSLVIADKSDHNIPGEQPEIIVAATRTVLDAVRGH